MGDRPGERLETRLFMQLLVFHCDAPLSPTQAIQTLSQNLVKQQCNCVVYEDVNNPRGIAVLSWSQDPSHFISKVRPAFAAAELNGLRLLPEFTMLGRTYSTGFEPDLKFWLLDRPHQTALNPAWPWAVWYPLRRIGAFEQLGPQEKGAIMKEHGDIGKAYGAADLVHDIRLACHGLDAHDNEFVLGLIGKDLHPLSHVVQAMRKTRQTAEFIGQMGPFFVGHVVFRNSAA
jgi:chlorite dismutase